MAVWRTGPLLSIGLPVYNGAKYLSMTLEDLRKQEFTDFEVLIADNASTDETPQIAQSVAEADSRFRYVRHPKNIGSDPNWNYLFHNTTGQNFAWIGADDRVDPRFYDRCMRLLARHPEAVAAFTGV